MRGKRLYAIFIVGFLIISGLGFVSLATNDPDETNTVPRVVFAEDFTNWGCGPCAAHNPAWTGAIEALGYGVVAPAYTHVHWPSSTDPMNNYGNMYDCANNRRNLQGCTWAPWPMIDGAYVADQQGGLVIMNISMATGSILKWHTCILLHFITVKFDLLMTFTAGQICMFPA